MSEHEFSAHYADTREHLRDELLRVELLLREHFERAWNRPANDDELHLPGVYVSHQEVDQLLVNGDAAVEATMGRGGASGTVGAGATNHERLEVITRHVHLVARESVSVGIDLRLWALKTEFSLTDREFDALLLAIAPDIDPKYERVYGFFRDDITASRPTTALLARILAATDGDQLVARRIVEDGSTLVDAGIITLEGGPTRASRTVRVKDRFVSFVLGSDRIAGAIHDVASVHRPTEPSELYVDEDQRRNLERVAGDLRKFFDGDQDRDAQRPPFAALVGPDERSAMAAAEHLGFELDVPIVRVDVQSVGNERWDEQIRNAILEARLQNGILHLVSVDTFGSEQTTGGSFAMSPTSDRSPAANSRSDLLMGLSGARVPIVVSGDVPMSPTLQVRMPEHRVTVVDMSRPTHSQRVAIWSAIDGLPDEADPDRLAAMFRLTRGGIEDAMTTARSISEGALTTQAIREGCRLQSRQNVQGMAVEREPVADWNDIVLPEDTMTHLREIAAAVRHRGTVFDSWGMAERFGRGAGIAVLFSGKSGTGKTMAAEVIANAVDLPLYQIDLASVLSKYIGETERNLGRIFDAAVDSNAILFFDEADALFGTRTEISDARDRYANVEVDYLLQRIEDHDGCIILASNLEENIDEAFERRLMATVTFPVPGVELRQEIWSGIFPAATPTGELDISYLADFEIVGGSIKNAAVTAAFLAAEEESEVTMEHVVRAIRREFEKNGKLYDMNVFGEYQYALE